MTAGKPMTLREFLRAVADSPAGLDAPLFLLTRGQAEECRRIRFRNGWIILEAEDS